jgi:integrase
MATKTKEPAKVKEPIRLRVKNLANGNQSLYLDYYFEGKREYEFLKLYLVPETSAANKEANKETLKLANAIKSKKIVEYQNNAHGFPFGGTKSKASLMEYVERMAEKKKEMAGGDAQGGTHQTYRSLLYHLKKYSGEKYLFKDVDRDYCLGFIRYLKSATHRQNKDVLLDTGTQLTYITRLSYILKVAVADEIIVFNPFQQIKQEEYPKYHNREVCYLTIEEVRKLTATPCYFANVKNAFLFSCFTGLRFSDIRGLSWGKIRKDNHEKTFISYRQKKTQKWENLPLSNEAMKFLPERGDAGDDDSVYGLSNGGYENGILKTWAKSAGIDKRVTFHVARHTNATLLLSLEVPIETVSKILGHANIKTTQIYAKVIDKSKRDAVDKLDGLTD